MKVTGAQALFKSLEGEGVDIVFGIPGGAILPAYDPLLDSNVRHVLCRHEQGAGHAAEGYAWATGKVGVAIATSGPGGCNLVTALADAKMDSVPMVAITGQVPTPVVGNDAFQEADITGITMPVTKHNFLVKDANELAETIREAFHIARDRPAGPGARRHPEGRPAARDHVEAGRRASTCPATSRRRRATSSRSATAAKMIMEAKRPVLYVGGGVIKANATKELYKLADERAAAGRDHADGARRVPRRARARARHARHARRLHGGHRDAEGRPAGRARRAVRRPGDRPARRVRAGREGRSTSTSTRPRSARTARSTCRSSATART